MPLVPASGDPVLQIKDVDLVRDRRLLLEQVSLRVQPGEHWALLGPNGAGKSTLLSILGAYRHPTRGTAEILGQLLGRVDVHRLRGLIGQVNPHHPVQSQSRTVHQVVLTGATGTTEPVPRWTPTPAELDRAAELMALMGLERLRDARWANLSHGERGRTLIARALMPSPRLLLLDEPATGLDVAARERLLESIDGLRERHPDMASILVTHHLEELPASTGHAMLLRAGRVLASGAVDDVLTTENVSACFDHPIAIHRRAGRWTATAGRVPQRPAEG
ncbi:iron complex transport system ATP-binding protein [Thermomonospora echinospora]|uniref:Iron complex transport system ATP-binding protein n=1 Tax=Thermomonospora echinospora TaxID=1992 RepID=A0A1H5TKE2_9ACTN|nr:ATP-binding cassette domain-containing protein [Thermomonospora echinospora]SEF62658.1 iron complex transport system ATP-binding protein [Thermomonospora echinospora]